MSQKSNRAVVVTARCSRSKDSLFCIRAEEVLPDIWFCNWAFSIDQDVADREGYGEENIKGAVDIDEKRYPGCPYCRDTGFYECGVCSRLNCWNRKDEVMTCAWCDTKVKLGGAIDSLKAGDW